MTGGRGRCESSIGRACFFPIQARKQQQNTGRIINTGEARRGECGFSGESACRKDETGTLQQQLGSAVAASKDPACAADNADLLIIE